MIARDIIYRALRLIGAYGSGETPSADDADVCLKAMNSMLDSWSTERLFVYAMTSEQFALTVGQAQYTIGTGGDFNTTRPQKVDDSSFIRLNGSDYLLTEISESQYSSIVAKTAQSIPDKYFYNATSSLGQLNLYPVPDQAMTLHLKSWKPLSSFASLNTDVTFAPGYQRALEYSLAEEISPEFDIPVPASVERIARQSRASVKRMNSPLPILAVPVGIMARHGDYDIYSDS